MIACENSGYSVFNDFAEVSKIVEAGVATKPNCNTLYRQERSEGSNRKNRETMPEDLSTPGKSLQQIEKEQMQRLRKKQRPESLCLMNERKWLKDAGIWRIYQYGRENCINSE